MSTAELARVEPLLPMEPAAARAAMERYRELTEAMLVADDWQQIPNGRFVKRSGWQKIATGYGISCEILVEEVERDATDKPVRAHAVVRATHPNGRYQDGSGRCSIDEERFRSNRGRQKLEHDLPATAVTRASNRAVSNLVGFGQVSAEEMDGSTVAPNLAQPYGPEGSESDDRTAAIAIQKMHPSVNGVTFVKFVCDTLGTAHLPEAAVRMVAAIAWALSVDEHTYDPPEAAVSPPAGSEAQPDAEHAEALESPQESAQSVSEASTSPTGDAEIVEVIS